MPATATARLDSGDKKSGVRIRSGTTLGVHTTLTGSWGYEKYPYYYKEYFIHVFLNEEYKNIYLKSSQ